MSAIYFWLGRRSACGKKNPEVTIPQVHMATNALIDALSLPEAARQARLEHAAHDLDYWQARNQQARRSHTKTRLARLEKLHITPAQLPRCNPG